MLYASTIYDYPIGMPELQYIAHTHEITSMLSNAYLPMEFPGIAIYSRQPSPPQAPWVQEEENALHERPLPRCTVRGKCAAYELSVHPVPISLSSIPNTALTRQVKGGATAKRLLAELTKADTEAILSDDRFRSLEQQPHPRFHTVDMIYYPA